MSPRSLLSTLAAAVLAAALLTGCAGDGGGPSGAGASAFAGSYTADYTLDGGKSGDLAITVAADSSVSGALVVAAPVARVGKAFDTRAEDFSFTVGSLTVSGNVSNGQLNLTGTDPNSGGFTITGSLPTSPADNTVLTLSAGGINYTAQVLISQGSGSGSLTFTTTGANINSAAFPATPYVLMSTVAGNTAMLAIPSVTDTSRSVNLTLVAEASAGTSHTFSDTNIGVVCVYSDSASGTDVDWKASSGTLKVISRTDSTIKLEFVNAVFTSSQAPGSFTLNGILQK